jgi:hypothetical protein
MIKLHCIPPLGRGKIPFSLQSTQKTVWDDQVFNFIESCVFGNDRVVMIQTLATG